MLVCADKTGLKVTVHLERCFQFFVCNSANTHRIPTNLYINEKLMKLSSLFVSFSTICALIPCWGFLIVRVINFLQAFEENSLFAAYETALIES